VNSAQILYLAVLALPVIIAITFHEAAHGFAAKALGDDTAAREGRLTLNPLAHLDPWGTLLLPAVMLLTMGVAFGYAKPVPVDASRLRRPVRDMALVAAAGPLTNIALAVSSAVLLALTSSIASDYPLWQHVLELSVVLNFVLAILNFIPLPPLDGSKIAAMLLPPRLSNAYLALEPFGFMILVTVLVIVPIVSLQLGNFIDTAGALLIRPAYFLSDALLALVGAQ